MKTGYVYEGDEWVQGGDTITSPETLEKIATVAEQTTLIVEHRHYRGSRSPTRLFFEDREAFLVYLNEHARPGDAFLVWPFDLCNDANAIASGKYPNEVGRVPRKGAY